MCRSTLIQSLVSPSSICLPLPLNLNLDQEWQSTCQARGSAENCARFTRSIARVVEWQTRTFEGRMPKGMRVQVPPRAPTHQWAPVFFCPVIYPKPLAKNNLVAAIQRTEKSRDPHRFPYAIHSSMPRGRTSGARPPNGGGGAKAGGSTVCALCGSTIKAGSFASHEPVIYSICSTCKKMPHRNPG